MRIQGSLLIFLTVCLGTALAITGSEEGDSALEPGAPAKDIIHTLGASVDVERNATTHFDLSAIKRPIPKPVRNARLFESRSWYAPAAIPVGTAREHAPQPQPMVPSLPFTFIGRMLDGKEVTVFISANDRRYAVKEKDVLDGTYRIDEIGESGVVLTYLPSNTQQTLSFNSTHAANSLISASDLKAVMHPEIRSHQSTSN